MFDKRADTQWIPVSQGTTRNHKVDSLEQAKRGATNRETLDIMTEFVKQLER